MGEKDYEIHQFAYLVFLTRYAIEIREREDMKLRMFGGFEQTDMWLTSIPRWPIHLLF